MTEGPGVQGIAQCLHDRILPEELGKLLWSPGARENLVSHPDILLDPFQLLAAGGEFPSPADRQRKFKGGHRTVPICGFVFWSG
jgi:hypothetical protein